MLLSVMVMVTDVLTMMPVLLPQTTLASLLNLKEGIRLTVFPRFARSR